MGFRSEERRGFGATVRSNSLIFGGGETVFMRSENSQEKKRLFCWIGANLQGENMI